MSPPKKKLHIFIVSDATGTTAEMVINAVLVQLKDIKPVFKKFPDIRTKEQITAILSQANVVEGIVIYPPCLAGTKVVDPQGKLKWISYHRPLGPILNG